MLVCVAPEGGRMQRALSLFERSCGVKFGKQGLGRPETNLDVTSQERKYWSARLQIDGRNRRRGTSHLVLAVPVSEYAQWCS